MHPDEGFHDHAGTVMIISWGQFMDHDFTLQATPLGKYFLAVQKNSLESIKIIFYQVQKITN